MAIFKGKKNEITLQVTAEMIGDNMAPIKVPFRVTYKKLPVSEAREVMALVKDEKLTDENIMERYLVTWADLQGEDGEMIEFSPAARDEAMELDGYRKALVEGWMQVQFGRQAVRAKN